MCAVQVWSGSAFLGSGFFVAPQTVATCAHVVLGRGEVLIRWVGHESLGTVLVRAPAVETKSAFHSFPDVAFIRVTAAFDHPFPYFDDVRPAAGAVLQAFGFSMYTPDAGVAGDSTVLTVIGEASRYLKVTPGNIAPGLSGAPVVDLDTGHVRGMVKAGSTRDVEGAFVVPGTALQEVWRTNRAVIDRGPRTGPKLTRPEPGHPLHTLLRAQRAVARRFPYRIAPLTGRPTPDLTTVYVEQRAQGQRPAPEASGPGLLVPEVAPLITPHEMVRKHRNALMVGPPGGGKSTLLLQLAHECAAWWLAADGSTGDEPDLGPVVAVRAAAVDLLTRRGWVEAMASAVNRELAGFLEQEVAPAMFRAPPTEGAQWLVMVDGLDEVLDAHERRRLLDVLAARVAEYGTTVRFLVTSRRLAVAEFDRLRASLAEHGQDADRLGEYVLHPFDEAAVARFAENWFRPPGMPASRTPPQEFLAGVAASGIGPLVRVPLLATIAAVVFEERPRDRLPIDRTGLYEEFVRVSLTGRRPGGRSRRDLVASFAELVDAPIGATDRLLDQRDAALAGAALRALKGDRRPLTELALEWLREHLPDLAVREEHVRELLLSTGLVVDAGGHSLAFTHQSIAEYLAARGAATTFDRNGWTDRVRENGADSYSLFVLGRWARSGNDPVPVVRDLLRGRPRTAVDGLAAVIEDGGALVGPHADAVLAAVIDGVPQLRGIADGTLDVLNHLLRATALRASDPTALRRLAGDRRVAVMIRAETARVLVTHGDAEAVRAGLAALIGMAYEEPCGNDDRLWAQRTLADVGGDRERPHAVQRLAQAVETVADEAVRNRALILLAGLGELPAAITAVVRRAADAHRPLPERIRALDVLFVVLEAAGVDEYDWRAAGRHAEGLRFASGSWTARRSDSETAAILGESHHGYVDLLGRALVVAARADPDGTGELVDAVMRDRTFTWPQRVRMARHLRPTRPDLMRRAMDVLAEDRAESAANRVLSIYLFRRMDELVGSDEQLRRWALDPEANLALRSEAINVLAARIGAATARNRLFLEEFLADPGHPRVLRRQVAVLLGRYFDGWERARVEVRRMRREAGSSPADLLGGPALWAARTGDAWQERIGRLVERLLGRELFWRVRLERRKDRRWARARVWLARKRLARIRQEGSQPRVGEERVDEVQPGRQRAAAPVPAAPVAVPDVPPPDQPDRDEPRHDRGRLPPVPGPVDGPPDPALHPQRPAGGEVPGGVGERGRDATEEPEDARDDDVERQHAQADQPGQADGGGDDDEPAEVEDGGQSPARDDEGHEHQDR
ncbi:hypothetical protein Val02_22260 [Virgisporangium aliadipatigenens]|uniref:NACHT domain-containing protein n=2 Tax=Virgisporangium aliadipatigenens TaxID=741659 RepID=A0A8J4DNX0_9ACTN|nr:hypothetical protein Val02_22260 [Virgisporangium aliadipatigenens]